MSRNTRHGSRRSWGLPGEVHGENPQNEETPRLFGIQTSVELKPVLARRRPTTFGVYRPRPRLEAAYVLAQETGCDRAELERSIAQGKDG